jgi:ferredoxin-NADP reductase/ferredoxin
MPAEALICQTRTVRLRFTDGVEHDVQVGKSDTVLAASLCAGLRLVHQCKSGSCGTCVGRVVSGKLCMNSAAGHCLLPTELELGQRLLCLSTPVSDTCVQLDYPSSFLGNDAPVRVVAQISVREWIAANVVRLVLKLPDAVAFDFRCGQYVRLRVPGTGQWRSYSLATTPEALPIVELLVRILPQGVMSDYLRDQCVIGEDVELEGPHGSFCLRASQAPHVMIAGGTGLAPIMAMIDQVRRMAGRRPKVLVSFGCASPESLFYVEQLRARVDWMPNLEVRVTVDRGGADYRGSVGNPVHTVAPADVSDPNTMAYLCGPQPMIAAARSHLKALGLRSENVFAELFVPSAQTSAQS